MVGLFIESIGIIAGTLGVLAWIPQLKEVWITEKHEGISLSTLHLICTALLLWLIYGLMIMSIAIIISNGRLYIVFPPIVISKVLILSKFIFFNLSRVSKLIFSGFKSLIIDDKFLNFPFLSIAAGTSWPIFPILNNFILFFIYFFNSIV